MDGLEETYEVELGVSPVADGESAPVLDSWAGPALSPSGRPTATLADQSDIEVTRKDLPRTLFGYVCRSLFKNGSLLRLVHLVGVNELLEYITLLTTRFVLGLWAPDLYCDEFSECSLHRHTSHYLGSFGAATIALAP